LCCSAFDFISTFACKSGSTLILSKIQDGIKAYKSWLERERHHPRLYLWETVQQFQTHWNPDAADPVAMFDQSLQNSVTRRLWQTETWYPKKIMLEFWRFDPRTVRLMFDDLFNETRDPEGRASRFVFGCDSLLADYKRAHPTSVENNHYHSDYKLISLCLACRYPENYGMYDLAVFQKTLQAVGAREVPAQHDIGRFFKVHATLTKFLDQDPGVAAAMQRHLHPRNHYPGKTGMLTTDFGMFLAESR
jgi:hypothetical protein